MAFYCQICPVLCFVPGGVGRSELPRAPGVTAEEWCGWGHGRLSEGSGLRGISCPDPHAASRDGTSVGGLTSVWIWGGVLGFRADCRVTPIMETSSMSPASRCPVLGLGAAQRREGPDRMVCTADAAFNGNSTQSLSSAQVEPQQHAWSLPASSSPLVVAGALTAVPLLALPHVAPPGGGGACACRDEPDTAAAWPRPSPSAAGASPGSEGPGEH